MTSRNCRNCGDVFDAGAARTAPTGRLPSHCSTRCRVQHQVKRAKERASYDYGRIKRACAECGEDFEYERGFGRSVRFCSDFCRTKRRHPNMLARPLCCVPGCPRPRQQREHCTTCYARLRRTGSTDAPRYRYRSLSSTGYVIVSDKSHPLTNKRNGILFEHRKVLYDAIGPGPHQCHWCQREVDWTIGPLRPHSLLPDHLDGDKANNAPENLVPSCNPCNGQRGMFMSWVRAHADDQVLWQMYQDAIRKGLA